jgi:acyl-coenzyme A thioesterase PaaI-like protein
MMPKVDDGVSEPLCARPQRVCVVCGPDHPHGLRLRYDTAPDGSANAIWTPTGDWQGFQGIIHGGIIGTVLDEAMAKAVTAAGYEALTGELRVRFRHHVRPGEELGVRGWIVERTKRLVRAEAALNGPDGSERAHAWSVFLPLPKRPEPSPPAS